MYAVIQTGGKQYKVQPGDFVEIEKLEGDVGSNVKFAEVLMVSKPGAEKSEIWVGQPALANAAVEGQIVGQGRGEKILIIKMKRRKQYRRTQGHRQNLTHVLITQVDNGSGSKLALSNEDKTAKVKKFVSSLTPRDQAPKAKATKAVAKTTAKPAAKAKAAK